MLKSSPRLPPAAADTALHVLCINITPSSGRSAGTVRDNKLFQRFNPVAFALFYVHVYGHGDDVVLPDPHFLLRFGMRHPP